MEFCEAVSLMVESPTLIVIPFIPHGFQGHGLRVGRPMQRTLNGELLGILGSSLTSVSFGTLFLLGQCSSNKPYRRDGMSLSSFFAWHQLPRMEARAAEKPLRNAQKKVLRKAGGGKVRRCLASIHDPVEFSLECPD